MEERELTPLPHPPLDTPTLEQSPLKYAKHSSFLRSTPDECERKENLDMPDEKRIMEGPGVEDLGGEEPPVDSPFVEEGPGEVKGRSEIGEGVGGEKEGRGKKDLNDEASGG
jgi:hypothetical protein